MKSCFDCGTQYNYNDLKLRWLWVSGPWTSMHFCPVCFQNLTEFNTAHNRRNIALTELKDVSNPLKRKHKNVYVSFNEDEEIINPGI